MENVILLPKKKAIGSFCTTNVRSYVSLYLQESFASVISYFQLPCNRHGNRFFVCLFLESIKCYLCYRTIFPKNANQSR